MRSRFIYALPSIFLALTAIALAIYGLKKRNKKEEKRKKKKKKRKGEKEKKDKKK